MQRLLSRSLLSICVLLSLGACKPDGKAASATANADPLQLVGRVWLVEDIDGVAVSPPASPETAVMLVFAANGRMSGSTGCNRLMAGVSLGKGTITMTKPAATRAACLDPALGEQENRLTATLQNVATWTVTDGKLSISDASGKPILRLRQGVSPKPPAPAQ